MVEKAVEAASRSPHLRGLRAVLPPEQIVRAIGAVTKLRAGLPTLELHALTPDEREDLRDAFAGEAWQRIRKDLPPGTMPPEPLVRDLPLPEQVPDLLSAGLDPRPVIDAVKNWKPAWLRGICNEGQYLLEDLEQLFGRRELLPAAGFLEYVRTQLDPLRRPELERLRKQRGWTSPPMPPFWRWPEFRGLFRSSKQEI
jgi:hypothetical protein